MLAITIANIFFKEWFWLVIAIPAIIIVCIHRWKHPPPPPKPRKFLTEHKKTTYKIYDIFLIAIVVLEWVPTIYMSASIAVESILSNRTYNIEPLSESLRFALAIFLICAIPTSSVSAGLIGILSVFQLNITKAKRIILLVISLLPIIFLILFLFINHPEKPVDSRLAIKLSLVSLLGCWLINGPAIITGKHFFQGWWALLCKLRLVSGGYPE